MNEILSYKKVLRNKILKTKKECHQDSIVTCASNHIKIFNPVLDVDLDFYVSKGNKKLPKETYIFNLSSSHTCVSDKMGLCPYGAKNGDKSCYSYKAEIQYNDCLPCRLNQELCWNEIRDKNLIYEFILGLLLLSYQSRVNLMANLRINESGDFKDVLDVILLETVAKELYEIGVTVYTYTHRIDLINSIKNRCEYLVINGSDFMLHNQFKVVNKFTNDNLKCCGDCSKCNYCKVKRFKTIEVLKH